MTTLQNAAGLAYRSAGDPSAPPVLLVHGVPESSYMWRDVMQAVADAGRFAIAPDLPGFGDSEPDPPGTWERHAETLGRFVDALDSGPVALVTHDWGVGIGLMWACDNPGAVSALVVSDGGFFHDREWHEMAKTMRTPGAGEELMEAITREAFDAALRAFSPGMTDDALDEYWKSYADDAHRRGILELYRSGDFEKLIPYKGRLAALGVPALIVWGGQDQFAGVELAHRFHNELPDSELVIVEEAGHFVWEDAPEETTSALVGFLTRTTT